MQNTCRFFIIWVMKKIVICLTLLLLCGCSNAIKNEEINEFVHGFSYENCLEHVVSGDFIETYTETDEKGNELASHRIDCHFENNNQTIYIVAKERYFGSEKEIKQDKDIEIKRENGKYYIINDNQTSELSDEEAKNDYQKVFFNDKDVYVSGGLYYGDYLISVISKIENIIEIDKNKKTISFHFEDDDRMEGYLLSQNMVIDEYGMLLYNMQKIKDSTSGNCGIVIQEANYEYLFK